MKFTTVKSILFVGFLALILHCASAQQIIPEFLCDGVPPDNFVRNVTNCRAWIKCKADGRRIPGFCEEPYWFDQENQRCTNTDAYCYKCPDPNALLEYDPVPNSCNRFYRCLRGVAQEFICDDGLQFNNATKRCEAGVSCTPSESLQCPLNLIPGDFYAINNSTNCSIGLVCVGDPEPTTVECSPELHFSIDTLMCVNPENSGCTAQEPNTTTVLTSPPPTPPPPTTTTPSPSTVAPLGGPAAFFYK